MTGALDSVLRAALARSPLLEKAASETLDSLVSAGSLKKYQKGTYLFHQGDKASEVFLLWSGRVEVSSPAPSGGRKLHGFLDPPQLFGELSVVGDMTRTASVLAVEDSTAWAVASNVWLDVAIADEAVSRSLLRALAQQFQEHEGLIDDLLFLDLRGRVAKRLLGLGRREGDDADLRTDEITQNDLASLCGGTRENVTRVLSSLTKRGTIERVGHHYVLHDTEHLKRLASA